MPIVIVKGEGEEVRMAGDSRERMVRSAASLIGSRGVSATSFSDVLADSGAPRGSIYHHFPDGKHQLAEDAVRWTSGRVLAHQSGADLSSPTAILERFIDMWRQVVLGSHGRSGCVVAGVAIDSEADDGDSLIEVARETFRAWAGLLAEQLEAAGIAPARARTIGLTTLAGMEGALILCRAEGSVEPLDAVAEELLRLLPD
jgi:TetR/AcrR family transcriptional regulator, lmrAB and yxaGH operons repressor